MASVQEADGKQGRLFIARENLVGGTPLLESREKCRG